MPLPSIFLQLKLPLLPCRLENTIIIRHRFKIEKIILFFDDFLEKFGHSFEDIEVGEQDAKPCGYSHTCGTSMFTCTDAQAAYELAHEQIYMVHAQSPKVSRPTAANIKRHKGSSYYKIVITRPGAHSPRIEDVNETQMKQVTLAAHAGSGGQPCVHAV